MQVCWLQGEYCKIGDIVITSDYYKNCSYNAKSPKTCIAGNSPRHRRWRWRRSLHRTNWWVPLRSNSVYLPVAVCLTVRLERNKSTRRGAVGNPKPDVVVAAAALPCYSTVLRNTILSPANSAPRQTHEQLSRISYCSSSVRMFTVRVSNTIKGSEVEKITMIRTAVNIRSLLMLLSFVSGLQLQDALFISDDRETRCKHLRSFSQNSRLQRKFEHSSRCFTVTGTHAWSRSVTDGKRSLAPRLLGTRGWLLVGLGTGSLGNNIVKLGA